MAHLQLQIPQDVEHRLDDVFGPGRHLPGRQEQKVDIGKGSHLGPAVTADGHHRDAFRLGRVGQGVHDGRDQREDNLDRRVVDGDRELAPADAHPRRAAELDNVFGLYNLGRMLRNGQGGNGDSRRAALLFRQAAEKGHDYGQFQLAEMVRCGAGSSPDRAQGFYWMKKAALHGNPQAQHRLGELYLEGDGCVKNEREAVRWLRKAAQQGLKAAQHRLGTLLFAGRGVPQNIDEAAFWFRKASGAWGIRSGNAAAFDFDWLARVAAKGSRPAQTQLGMQLEQLGEREPGKIAQALQWYQKAADAGCDTARFRLGRLFHLGLGTLRDLEAASHYFSEAAEQGAADAQCSLGMLYQEGDGVEMNPRRACYWFQKAAGQGHPEAQYRLAELYRLGRGTGPNPRLAQLWLHRSADRGYLPAWANLGNSCG